MSFIHTRYHFNESFSCVIYACTGKYSKIIPRPTSTPEIQPQFAYPDRLSCAEIHILAST
jgi:hypothetical protein